MLVRTDLPPAQQTVQAIHGALESARHFPATKEHPHLVVLGVGDLGALHEAREMLKSTHLSHVPYREPDFDNQMTVIATGPIYGDERKHFRKYQLLKGA